MSVRAKFYVASITQRPGVGGGEVTLAATARGARNAMWASATPSGSMTMTINNPAAFDFFAGLVAASRGGSQPEVFIDITPATDGQVGDGHAFEVADVPETHYAHGNCAACGMPKEGTVFGSDTPYHPSA